MFQWTARAFAFTRKRPVGFVAMSSVRIKSSQAQPHITHLWVFNSLCHLHKEWGCPLHGASNKMSAVPTITSELSDFSVFNNLAPGPVWYLCLFVTIANTFPGALMEQQARQATAWGPKPVGRGPPKDLTNFKLQQQQCAECSLTVVEAWPLRSHLDLLTPADPL